MTQERPLVWWSCEQERGKHAYCIHVRGGRQAPYWPLEVQGVPCYCVGTGVRFTRTNGWKSVLTFWQIGLVGAYGSKKKSTFSRSPRPWECIARGRGRHRRPWTVGSRRPRQWGHPWQLHTRTWQFSYMTEDVMGSFHKYKRNRWYIFVFLLWQINQNIQQEVLELLRLRKVWIKMASAVSG